MYAYSKYIARHLLHSMLLITFSLTSIIWLTQALRFIDFIVNQGVSITVFLKLTMLLVPSLLLMILPPAMFCAVLFTYNKLKVDSELVVMQSAGLDRWRLARPAINVALCVMLLGYAISLYLQPLCYGKFREMQAYLRNNYVSILLQEGVFSSPVDGLTVFIRERDKDGNLHGILVHDVRQKDAPVTMMADSGKMVETSAGPRFILMGGNRQEKRNGRISFLNFDSYTLDVSLYTQSLHNRAPDAQELYLGQLLTPDSALSPQENRKRIAEANQRLLWPGYVLALTLVGLAVLLSGEFNRRGHWHRIVIATAFGTVILFAAVGLRGLMANYPAIIVLAHANLLFSAGAGAWVLRDLPLPGRRRMAAA